MLGEELLDGGPQGPREAQRSIDGRRVTARLDGRDQLAAHPGPSGQLGTVDLGTGIVTEVIDLGRVIELTVAVGSGLELRARSVALGGL